MASTGLWWAKMQKRVHVCPLCRGERLRRSERKGILESTVFRLVGLSPYRCSVCDNRFMDRINGSPKRSV
jgi:transposase-like protein